MFDFPFSSFKTISKDKSIIEIKKEELPDNLYLLDEKCSLTGTILQDIFISKHYYNENCYIKDNDIVVDIGANIGMFSLYALSNNIISELHCFEPDILNYKCLVENIKLNDNIFLYNNAVSNNNNDEKYLNINWNIGGHSLYDYTENEDKIKVNCINLNDLMNTKIPYIDFLKIDAEGSEYDILMSLSDENISKIDRIVIEYHTMILGEEKKNDILLKLDKYFNHSIGVNNQYISIMYFWRKTFDNILGHTSFIPHTGYAYHARDFFTRLNKYIPTRIRNFAHTPDLSHLTEEQKNMVIEQKWSEPPYEIGKPYKRDYSKSLLNIILMESNHYYYYHNYEGPKIAYNVWESTRQDNNFFNKLLEYDQLWVPTEWQKNVTIEQGYPEEKIKVVHEGVDFNIFNTTPVNPLKIYNNKKFKFLIFGRWDYRKSTTEMIKAFLDEFKSDEPVELLISVDNSFPVDNMTTTEQRLKYYGLNDKRIKNIGFCYRDDYTNYLKNGHVYLSCSRAEGWNLPLCEAIACGIPTICSSHGAQLEFAKDISHIVNTKEYKKPEQVFMSDDTPGLWDEPDFEHLRKIMRYVYENYEECKKKALNDAKKLKENFKWEDAVRVSKKYIADLYREKNDYKLKINVGCGDFKLKDYINIDLEDGLGEVKMNALNLLYQDNTVDEVYSSHLLEHFGKNDVLKVLNEWYRVLKYNGKLVLEIPDLKWCINNYLTNENDTWALDTIFGNQNNSGEYHKTGFTKEKITSLLKEVGFTIEHFNNVFSHGQNCFKIECIKNDIYFDDDIFVISTYPNTEDKLKILKEKISYLKKYNKPIAIATHYILPEEIIKEIDYLIYDKNNPMSEDWSLNYWVTIPEKLKIISSYEKKYHAVTVLTNLVNSINYLSTIYNFMHFIEFDTDLNLDEYLKIYGLQRNKDKKLICFNYDIEQKHKPDSYKGIITNILSLDLKYYFNIFSKYKIRDWKSYISISDIMNKESNEEIDYIFENWFRSFIRHNKSSENTYIIPTEIKEKIYTKRNLFDQGDDELPVRIHITRTKDEKIIFLSNFKSNEPYNFEIIYGDKNINKIHKDILEYNEIQYYVFNKDENYVRIKVNDIIDNEYDLNNDNIVNSRFRFYNDEYICVDWKNEDNLNFKEEENKIVYSFFDNPKVEIFGDKEMTYNVKFIDNNNNMLIYQGKIKNNNWIATSRRYVTDWKIIIEDENGNIIDTFINDYTNKKVLIHLDSKSLGDTIAWLPYTVEFKNKYNCEVFVTTFHNHLFDKNYPELNFVNVGINTNLFDYFINLGCRDNDYFSNKNNWKTIPLQQVASDYLNLDYKEIKPKIVGVNKERPIKEKYVCISEHSTMRSKYWNNANGWQEVVDFLNAFGYKVMVISKEQTSLKNIINMTNKPIDITINNLEHCDFFIGVSSGLSWLAWGLNKPVIIISGATNEFVEMKDCIRIINKDVCNSCLNDKELIFDRGNWLFCPRNKNFECTTSITSEFVLSKIAILLNKYFKK